MSLLQAAAMQAALADGLQARQQEEFDSTRFHEIKGNAHIRPATAPTTRAALAPPKRKPAALRRGKWTAEEEAYANRLILEFKAGLLPLTDGTTLRTFLSKLLNCDPMRISKKFVGNNCIGKQVFRRKAVEMNKLTIDQLQRSRDELTELERKFLDRVSQTSRCKPGVMPKLNSLTDERAVMSPWVAPPSSYHPSNSRASAAGRSLLGEPNHNPYAPLRNPNNPLDQNLTMSQLTQLRQNNGGPRTSSFEALMSLDFESMQSMENLNNANSGIKIKEYKKPSEHQNWSSEPGAGGMGAPGGVAGMNVVQQQQLAQAQSLVNGGVNPSQGFPKPTGGGVGPNIAGQFSRPNSIPGGKVNYIPNPADMFRVTSSTGLTALRDQQGLNPLRNSSVEDFLSLVASGDIPAQDPHMLNIPLQSYIANAQRNPSQQNLAALHQLQQQIIAQQVKNIQVPMGGAMGGMNPMGGPLNPQMMKQFQGNQAAQYQQFQQMQQQQMQQQQMMMQAQMQQQQQQFQALQQAHNAAAAQQGVNPGMPNGGLPPSSPGAPRTGVQQAVAGLPAGLPAAPPAFVGNQPNPNAVGVGAPAAGAGLPQPPGGLAPQQPGVIPAPLATAPVTVPAAAPAPVAAPAAVAVAVPQPVDTAAAVPIPKPQANGEIVAVAAPVAVKVEVPPSAAAAVGGKRKAEEEAGPTKVKKEKVKEPAAVSTQ